MPNLSNQVVTLTDATFDEEVTSSPDPVLVDFTAPWCHPCKLMEPVLVDVAQIHEGTLRVGKLDIEDNRMVTQRYGVMSFPTLIVFKDGEPALRLVGARGKGQLLEELSRVL